MSCLKDKIKTIERIIEILQVDRENYNKLHKK